MMNFYPVIQEEHVLHCSSTSSLTQRRMKKGSIAGLKLVIHYNYVKWIFKYALVTE